jgi:DNA modification methylase
MDEVILQVREIPQKVENNTTLEISTPDLGYFTHSFFKYPCKFIPQIPKWAIEKYTQKGDIILDCFAGSGTTLVEAVLAERNAVGVDFDKLSNLLCDTKTVLLSNQEVNFIYQNLDSLFIKNNDLTLQLPDLHNLSHWFSETNIENLAVLKANILQIESLKIRNFLFVCFASIIKKCSFTEEGSPKPYISSRFPKEPQNVKESFKKVIDTSISQYKKYPIANLGTSKLIAQDARNIDVPEYAEKIDLAITSPPYINAFDYVRSLRLENAWLGFFGDTNILEIKKQQIGTETVSSKQYSAKLPITNIELLDEIINKIAITDRKRAYIVWKYFDDMQQNILAVKQLLKPNAHYIIVVGNSLIREIEVPTHEILIKIAEKQGFNLVNCFSYLIKNRYLRIPRGGKGGLIKKDWIIDLQKTN